MCRSLDVNLSRVIHCINIKQHRQSSVVSEPTNQSMHVQRGWAVQMTVKLQSTELGLWPGADSLLTASVWVACMAMSMSDRTLDVLLYHLRNLD